MQFEARDVKTLCDGLRAHFPSSIPQLDAKSLPVLLPLCVLETLPEFFKRMSPTSDLTFDEAANPNLVVDLEYLKILLLSVGAVSVQGRRRLFYHPHRRYLELSLFGRNLRRLELLRVDVRRVRDFESLVENLCILKISRAPTNFPLCDVFHSDTWKRLRILALDRNQIRLLRKDTLKCFRNVRRLDLSYNLINEDAGNVEILTQLTHLTLCFNRIEALSRPFPKSLRVLHLEFNRLGSLSGLETCVNLEELDVSFNLILNHDRLAALSRLPRLKRLETSGNPIASHKSHRRLTLNWVNAEVDPGRFQLNRVFVSLQESYFIGLSRLHCPRPATTRRKSARKSNIRVAEIAEPDYEYLHSLEAQKRNQPEVKSEDLEHLETKRQVEELRRIYGEDNWLQGAAGDRLQELLGITKPDPRSTDEIIAEKLAEIKGKEDDINRFVQESSKISSTIAEKQQQPEEQAFDSMYADVEEEEEDEAEDKDKGVVIKVQTTHSEEKRLLKIDGNVIREESEDGGKALDQWHLYNAELLDIARREPFTVHLAFTDVRGASRERTYRMSETDFKTLEGLVKPHLEDRAKRALDMGALQCVKCQTEFTYEKSNVRRKRSGFECPNCGSTMVIEMESMPVPTAKSKASSSTKEVVMSSATSSLNEATFLKNVQDSSTPRKKKDKEDSPQSEGRNVKQAIFYYAWLNPVNVDQITPRMPPKRNLMAVMENVKPTNTLHANNGNLCRLLLLIE